MRQNLHAILLIGLLAACSATPESQEQAQGDAQAQGVEQAMYRGWTNSTFFPNEYCWQVYRYRDDSSPVYWRIRRWCDQREMRSDFEN